MARLQEACIPPLTASIINPLAHHQYQQCALLALRTPSPAGLPFTNPTANPLYPQSRFRNMTDLQILHEHHMMSEAGLKPGEVSTGTTILALPFDGGVVVCADSRTSTGTYVANRVSDKLVQLSDYIYACRSGSAADTQALTDYVHYFLNQWR